MANSEDEAKTTHAPGSQPSTERGSGEPQTITAPTPPVGRNSEPPEPGDLADEEDGSERSPGSEEPGTTSEND